MKYIVATSLAAALLFAAGVHAQTTQVSTGANSPNINGVKEVNLGTGSSKAEKPETVESLKQQLASEHKDRLMSDLNAAISDANTSELQAQNAQQQAQQKVQTARQMVETTRVALGLPEGTTYDFQKHQYVPPAPKAAAKK